MPSRPGTMDQSSNSRPEEVVVTHLDWTVNVDFAGQYLKAEATYSLRRLNPSATVVNLDTANLDIESVAASDGESLSHTLHPLDSAKSHLGRRLEIALPKVDNTDEGNDQFVVTIVYKTTASCSALQWLPPSQTAGKVFPYLFTQCQAIHARSLVPCQDRCGVKMTYKAKVTVPAWSTCVMSAVLDGTEVLDDAKVYTWYQPVPISSYLLALAVGELAKKDISNRCAIWSEPSIVEQAAYEFAETEDFLAAAEHISGTPYAWGRYDVLCLPPSFPFGGMENPCLTFVTPTLLAGDRSLADVVAHEISHSWTGECWGPGFVPPVVFRLLEIQSLTLRFLETQTPTLRRKPGYKCHMGPLLAQRRLDDMVPTQDHVSNQGQS
jgi:leukotriene-A4 hydrolase